MCTLLDIYNLGGVSMGYPMGHVNWGIYGIFPSIVSRKYSLLINHLQYSSSLNTSNITYVSITHQKTTALHSLSKHSTLTSKLRTVFSDASKVDSASFFSAKRLSLISYTIQAGICETTTSVHKYNIHPLMWHAYV